MVRLLLIRHGESVQNVFQSKVATLDPEEHHRQMRAESSEVDGDVTLSPLGFEQCERLAEVWAPLLEEKARSGQLHVFVSPMKRALLTAHPLMTELHRRTGCTAEVLPALHEFGGLTAPSDMIVFDDVERLRRAGASKEDVARTLREFKWRANGKTGSQILSEFPWAALSAGFPLDSPWYTKGFESPKLAAARMARLTRFTQGLRERFAEGDVVAYVAHGGTIADLLHSLLLKDLEEGKPRETRSNFEAISNTSVTSLVLPGARYRFGPSNRGGLGLERWGVRLEFLNNLVHLGPGRLRRWAADNSLVKGPSSKL